MAYRELYDKELGIVRLSMRRNASRISARWDKGKVLVILPVDVDAPAIAKAIDSMRAGLLARRSNAVFDIGKPLALDGGVVFHIERYPSLGMTIDLVYAKDGFTVRVGGEVDMADFNTQVRISRLMMHGAKLRAPEILLPRAREIAARLGLSPRSFSISRGHKVLGHCSSRGEIALSAVCVFLPWELRDYVICHELAHLSEMNHSDRFHRLCDSYLSGREADLERKLRSYQWPVVK